MRRAQQERYAQPLSAVKVIPGDAAQSKEVERDLRRGDERPRRIARDRDGRLPGGDRRITHPDEPRVRLRRRRGSEGKDSEQ